MAQAELYGGKVIAGAMFPALERIVVGFNVADLGYLDWTLFGVETMARNHDPDDPRRIWWHWLREGIEGWISINPGEFRREPPEPPAIVRELPILRGEIGWLDMLNAGIRSCSLVARPTQRELHILEAARRLAARERTEVPAELRKAISDVRNLPDNAALVDLVGRLHKEYFLSFRCTITDFSLCVLILQTQAISAFFIDSDWDDPGDALAALLAEALADGPRQAQTLAGLSKLVRWEFDEGRRQLAAGLGGTAAHMPSRLMWALHRFAMAYRGVSALERAGVPREDLPVDPIVAEEAVACTQTGIAAGARACMRDPDEEASRLLDDGPASLSKLKIRARALASETMPIFTRSFADILAVEALVHCGAPSELRAGVEALERLGGGPAGLDPMELSWIDQVLLKAFKRLGDEDQAAYVARRIAARLLLRFT